jgi:hypothetical protein
LALRFLFPGFGRGENEGEMRKLPGPEMELKCDEKSLARFERELTGCREVEGFPG